MSDYILYLLVNSCNSRTYLGITNNFNRRIRQHNNEIKGGAKYTTAFKQSGKWILHLHVPNLSKIEALSLERKIKNINKKSKGKTPLDRRIYSINNVIYNTDYKYVINDNNCLNLN